MPGFRKYIYSDSLSPFSFVSVSVISYVMFVLSVFVHHMSCVPPEGFPS